LDCTALKLLKRFRKPAFIKAFGSQTLMPGYKTALEGRGQIQSKEEVCPRALLPLYFLLQVFLPEPAIL
jgi:hypothetical protein